MLWCGGRCRVVEHMTRMTTTEKALLFNCRGLVMSPEYKGVYDGHNGETGLNTGIWRKDNDSWLIFRPKLVTLFTSSQIRLPRGCILSGGLIRRLNDTKGSCVWLKQMARKRALTEKENTTWGITSKHQRHMKMRFLLNYLQTSTIKRFKFHSWHKHFNFFSFWSAQWRWNANATEWVDPASSKHAGGPWLPSEW